MDTKKLEVDVPKEVTEVGECVQEILVQTALALEDGWSPWKDVPRIIKRSFAEFLVAAKGMKVALEETKERPMLATAGILVPICKGVDTLLESRKAHEEKSFVCPEEELSREEQINAIMSFLEK